MTSVDLDVTVVEFGATKSLHVVCPQMPNLNTLTGTDDADLWEAMNINIPLVFALRGDYVTFVSFDRRAGPRDIKVHVELM